MFVQMKRASLFLLFSFGFWLTSQSQTIPDNERYFGRNNTSDSTTNTEINVKLNLLNMPFGNGWPSLHCEVQAAKRMAVHFSFNYLEFFQIFTEDYLKSYGGAATARFYSNQKKSIRGLYAGIGGAAMQVRFFVRNNHTLPFRAKQYYGLRTELGYKLSAKAWVFDFGAGLNFFTNNEILPTLMFGVGYKIRK